MREGSLRLSFWSLVVLDFLTGLESSGAPWAGAVGSGSLTRPAQVDLGNLWTGLVWVCPRWEGKGGSS